MLKTNMLLVGSEEVTFSNGQPPLLWLGQSASCQMLDQFSFNS